MTKYRSVTHTRSLRTSKGQSAIEYLTTYGWMLLVIAIVGGAVFTTVQGSSSIDSSGFDVGSGVAFVDGGLTSSNSFQMALRNQEAEEMTVEKITLTGEEGNKVVARPDKTLPVGEEKTFNTIGLAEASGQNSVNVEITYDAGGLNNLAVNGSITGAFSLDPERAEPGNGDWEFVDVSETPDRYMDASGMSDFYLMKYEARNDGSGEPVSEPGTSIWTNINQTQAAKKCRSIGASLVSDRQWNAVAHQAAMNPSNWADGNVGSSIGSGGGLYSGNTGDSDSVSYNGPDPDPSQSNATKRTLELANGDKVWDLSGNVWEWTRNSFKTLNGEYESPRQNNAPGDESWHELNEITAWNGMPSSSGTNSSWTGDEGVGRIYLNGDHTWGPGGENYNVSAVQRGGYWSNGQGAGVFSVALFNAPSHSDGGIGFRCSLSPAS